MKSRLLAVGFLCACSACSHDPAPAPEVVSAVVGPTCPGVPGTVELPPIVPEPGVPMSIPDDLVCPSIGECPNEATWFLDTQGQWGLDLEMFDRGEKISERGSRTNAHGYLVNQYQSKCPANSFEDWADCVAARRSVSSVFPEGRYQFPTEGWLIVTAGGMTRSEQVTAWAVDLQTGLVHATDGGMQRSGRVEPSFAREVALLLALDDHVGRVANMQILDFPGTAPPEAACYEPDPRRWGPRYHNHRHVEYWRLRDGHVVDARRIYVSGELGMRTHAQRLVSALDHAATAPPRPLEFLLPRDSPEALLELFGELGGK